MEKLQTIAGSGTRSRNIIVGGAKDVKAEAKATPEEIKDKLEQQLKLQRAALAKRTHTTTTPTTTPGGTNVVKFTPNSTQQKGDNH